MDGSNRAGSSSAGGAWRAMGPSGPVPAGQGDRPLAGAVGGSQGHPALSGRASRDAAPGPRASLGDTAPAARSAPGWWRAAGLFASTPAPRPAAPIDVDSLNDSAQGGRLARSVLQLALDWPGQTLELDLALSRPDAFARDPSRARTDRILSLRFQPGTGMAVSTSAPSAGAVSFGIRDPSVLGGEADAVAGLLDRVSSLSRFTVLRVRTDPPPVATGLPGPHPEGRLPAHEQSLIGVARWPERAHNREDDPQQQAYGRSFWHTTRDAGAQLAQGRIRSLRELWTYAQDWRGSKTAESDRPGFGLASQRRDRGVASCEMTPLTGPYAYLVDRCKQRTDGTLEYPERHSMRYAIHDTIGGKRLALTSVSIRTRWDERSASRHLASRGREYRSGDGPPPFRINHTSVANAQHIMDHAEPLFSRVMNPVLPQAEALAALGELHWWLAHAMPDTRGSAAKAELCVRSLAQARGMDLPPFKPGFVPDLEAMIRPRADYVDGYAGAFSRPPEV